jgi:hypothetical protein
MNVFLQIYNFSLALNIDAMNILIYIYICQWSIFFIAKYNPNPKKLA